MTRMERRRRRRRILRIKLATTAAVLAMTTASIVMKPARSARLSIGMTKHTEFRTGS